MKKYGTLTLELSNMNGVKNKEGIPHIAGVPCIWDRYFRFSSAEFLGLSEWICPHCFTNLSMEEREIICLNDCHRKTHPKRVQNDD